MFVQFCKRDPKSWWNNADFTKPNAVAGVGCDESFHLLTWLSFSTSRTCHGGLRDWLSEGTHRALGTKLYFNNTGLASHLMGISSGNFATSPFVGALWENAVFGEIRRYLSLSQRSDSVWFYRDNQQREIDFMVFAGGKAALLECKWAERPDDSATKSITELQKLVREKKIPDFAENRGFVVCRTPHQFPLGKSDVHAI